VGVCFNEVKKEERKVEKRRKTLSESPMPGTSKAAPPSIVSIHYFFNKSEESHATPKAECTSGALL
jgi:hypothetical protein